MPLLSTERHGPWTVGDLRKMPEDEFNRYEIDDGVVIVSPRPSSPHQYAARQFANLLDDAAKMAELDLVAVNEVEVVTSRRDDWLKVPDIALVAGDAFDCEPQEYEAADAALAVEISGSRQSHRRDFGEKREAYAEVGIEHYWILDLGPTPRLTVFRLVGDAYKEIESATGPIAVTSPFAVEIDPARLVRRRR